MTSFRQARASVNHRAYVLLLVTSFFWGGNVVAGRLAVGEMSPMSVVALRWLVAAGLLLPLIARDLPAALPVMKPQWKRLVAMGALGFTGFNALFYASAYYTNGVNIAIIQGTVPIFVLAGAAIVFGQRTGPMQWLGLALTLAGVIIIAARGQLDVLAALDFNRGDLYNVLACVIFAFYSLALRNKPAVKPMTFFGVLAVIAFLTSLPLLAIEIWNGWFFWPSWKGMLVLLYVGLGPSFLAQILYIRSVEMIGPARAGPFYNLVPVIGAMLSVLLLSDPFAPYHAVALVLVLAGIFVSEQKA